MDLPTEGITQTTEHEKVPAQTADARAAHLWCILQTQSKMLLDRKNCGSPKFIISEFVLNNDTGFLENASNVDAGNPNQLWDRLFTGVLGLAAPHHDADLCGFGDDSLTMLLDVKTMPSFESFLKFDDFSDRYQRISSN